MHCLSATFRETERSMVIIQLTREEIQQIIRSEIASALAAMQSKAEDELLSRRSTAEYLGVTLPTLNAWEKKGYIKAKRIGARVYFMKSSLMKANPVSAKQN